MIWLLAARGSVPNFKMTLAGTVYKAVFKRTSNFVLAIAVSAFAFERGFDMVTDYAWESHNKGKLWKDIKHKYEEKEE